MNANHELPRWRPQREEALSGLSLQASPSAAEQGNAVSTNRRDTRLTSIGAFQFVPLPGKRDNELRQTKNYGNEPRGGIDTQSHIPYTANSSNAAHRPPIIPVRPPTLYSRFATQCAVISSFSRAFSCQGAEPDRKPALRRAIYHRITLCNFRPWLTARPNPVPII